MHALSPMRLKVELWLGIITMLFLAACSGCGGCGGAEQREGPAFPAQNTCIAAAAAKDIGRGVSFREDFKDLSAGLTFTMDACVSVQATEGSDFFYKAVVPPNHQLRVGLSIYNGAQPSIYVFTDCEDAAGTCIKGSMWSEEERRYPSVLHFNTTESPQTLIIGIDSTNSEGVVEGSLSVDEIECLPGERRCDEAGEAIEYCHKDARYERYACDGLCTDGRCDTPSGDSCVDAIKLEGDTGAITGDWSSGTNLFKPSNLNSGQCYINGRSTPRGLEDFYRVELQEGESLQATLSTSSGTAALFIVEDCEGPESCVQHTSQLGPTTLRYYAQQARTIYVIVDNRDEQVSASYELQWTISAGQACIPDQARCADANTATLCNSNGTAETSYRCELGCAYGGCRITPTDHDSCTAVADSAQDVGQGINVIVDIIKLSDQVRGQPECLGDTSLAGKDLFYKIILAPDESVEVKTQSLGNNRHVIYAFTDCTNVNESCVAGVRSFGSKHGARLRYHNKTGAAQALIIGIDAGAPDATGLIRAQIAKILPQCESGTSTCAPDNADVLLGCDEQSQYVRYECEGGCKDGRCERPQGDVCFDAIELTGTAGTIEADWKGGTNSFVPLQGYMGLCYNQFAAFTARSREDFYRVPLEAGDILSLSLLSTTPSPSMFILERCADPQACVLNVGRFGKPELRYYAKQARTVYVVVEEASELEEGEYVLHWSVKKGDRCLPHQTRCLDATTAARCSEDGSTETQIPCAHGCDIRGCAPDVAQDSCESVAANPQDITASFSTYTHIEHFNPSLSIEPSETCQFRGRVEGGDFFYKVTLDANEQLKVTATANGVVYPILYLFKSCEDASGTCLAINGEIPERTATLHYANTTATAQTFLLGVASTISTGQGILQVDIDINTPSCSPGAVQCDANNTNLLQCDSSGRFELILCDGGCRDDACVKPSGDYCVDAIPLVGAVGSVSGLLNEKMTNTYELGKGYTGACYLDHSGLENDGKESFYRVDLKAGEELIAKLTADRTTAQLFLLTDCADLNSCVATGPTQGNVQLRYFAPNPQTVFIAVDNNSPSLSARYELTWRIDSSARCAAGTTTCLDPNTVSYCSPTGQTSATATCANGCFQGGCQAQAALQDVCSDVLAAATDVGNGLAIYALPEDFSDSITFSTENSCVGVPTPGHDLFYKVNLAPDEVVRATVQGYGGNNPLIYILEDCSQSATSCLIGARAQEINRFASVSYVNNTGSPKTVLVGVDSSRPANSSPIKATIERLAPECTPGAKQCAADGADLLQCSPQGLYERIPCDNGCANDACVTP